MNCYYWVVFIFAIILSACQDTEGWRRRRRRRCGRVNCAVSGWSGWSTCSQKCGSTGIQFRTRTITRGAQCGGGCPYGLKEARACNRGCSNGGRPIPGRCTCHRNYRGNCCEIGDGGWSGWGTWSSCTKTCGTSGTQRRMRSCTNPHPVNGGRSCLGSPHQVKMCTLQPCPGESQEYYEAKTSWWLDTVEHVERVQQIVEAVEDRRLIDPVLIQLLLMEAGNAVVRLQELESVTHQSVQVIDGGWGPWETWGPCTKTCGTGTRIRKRTCSQPRPAYGGKACPPPAIGKQICKETFCIKSVGCYAPISSWTQLKDYRSQVDWNNMATTVSMCAKLAQKQGYRFFSLQYYTKCMIDKSKIFDYKKNGQSSNCWSGVGMDNAMSVYLIL
ncbi:hypothetical protein QZH41_016400 [Actinostola sp. cb2023]|nr:hypothetical protein QZH41_016400 [Actinostola sp. cb2023]